MAYGLILEFEGVGAETYKRVNELLGVDESGNGAPEGQLLHAAGVGEGGSVVFEVWRSKEDQARFMEERLGKALREGGVTAAPIRMEWLELAAYFNRE